MWGCDAGEVRAWYLCPHNANKRSALGVRYNRNMSEGLCHNSLDVLWLNDTGIKQVFGMSVKQRTLAQRLGSCTPRMFFDLLARHSILSLFKFFKNG